MTISRRFFLLSSAVLASTPAVEIAHAATGGQLAGAPDGSAFSSPSPLTSNTSDLSHEIFSQHLSRTFRARREDQNIHQELTLVKSLESPRRKSSSAAQGGKSSPAGRFSLVFQGPLDRPLAQEVYTVELPGVGEWILLLVPVHHRDTTNRYYEAVINRL